MSSMTSAAGWAARANFMPKTTQAAAYAHLSYATLTRELHSLASEFPHLANLWTTQQRYNLPSAGMCGDAPCAVWVLEVTHRAIAFAAIRPEEEAASLPAPKGGLDEFSA